jgi:hypothetical protein
LHAGADREKCPDRENALKLRDAHLATAVT